MLKLSLNENHHLYAGYLYKYTSIHHYGFVRRIRILLMQHGSISVPNLLDNFSTSVNISVVDHTDFIMVLSPIF